MKIKSDFDSVKVEETMRKIFRRKIFNTDFTTVQSMPELNMSGGMNMSGPAILQQPAVQDEEVVADAAPPQIQ